MRNILLLTACLAMSGAALASTTTGVIDKVVVIDVGDSHIEYAKSLSIECGYEAIFVDFVLVPAISFVEVSASAPGAVLNLEVIKQPVERMFDPDERSSIYGRLYKHLHYLPTADIDLKRLNSPITSRRARDGLTRC